MKNLILAYSLTINAIFFAFTGYGADIFLTSGSSILKVDESKNWSVFSSLSGYNGSGLAFDKQGYLYVKTETDILKVNRNGSYTVFAQSPILSGSGAMVFDSDGNLYAGNAGTKSVTKITTTGQVSLYATNTSFSAAMTGIGIDSHNNLYVSTWENNSVIKITPGGIYSTFYQWTQSFTPTGLAVDSFDNVIVSSWDNRLIGKIDQAGNYSVLASGNEIYGPYGMAIDQQGNILSMNYPWQANNTITQTTPNGVLSTYASNIGGSGGGLRYLAVLPEPSALSLLAIGLGGLAMMRRRRRTV